jgi:hypothetical protein
LRFEVNRLSQEESRLRLQLLAQPLIGPMLIRLIQSGVKEQDIINMVHLFERNSRSGVMDMQLFISELDKYGSIKSTMEKLNHMEDKLRKDVASLEAQKQDLDTYNQRLIFNSVNSKQIIYYYRGLVDSLRQETLGLLSIVAFIMNYLLNLRFEELAKARLSHNAREIMLKNHIAGLADIDIIDNLDMIYPKKVKSSMTVSNAAELLMSIENPCLIFLEEKEEEGEMVADYSIVTPWDIVMRTLM